MASRINRTRGWAYKYGKYAGDVRALQTGRIGRRVARRVTGKGLGRLLAKIFG